MDDVSTTVMPSIPLIFIKDVFPCRNSHIFLHLLLRHLPRISTCDPLLPPSTRNIFPSTSPENLTGRALYTQCSILHIHSLNLLSHGSHPMAPKINKSTDPSPSSPSSAIRVRDNQRRARARRREYIQDLEAKLHCNEKQGIRASLEIQAAARKVVAENELLREEVQKLRGENGALRKLLGSTDAREGMHVTDTALVESHARIQEATGSTSSVDLASQTGICTAANPLSRLGTISTTTHNDFPDLSFELSSLPLSSAIHSPSRPSTSPMASTDDTSSCEHAAHIITSMRADVDREDVRKELGCGKGEEGWGDCRVRNGRVFGAVDLFVG